MNGSQLVDMAKNLVVDPRFNRSWYIDALNRGILAVASRILMPGLADGADSVDTAVDAPTAAMPSDFHRELYHAEIDGEVVTVKSNIAQVFAMGYTKRLEAGSVAVVCQHGTNLFYQQVPETSKQIDLLYYRKPDTLYDRRNSYPDGLSDIAEHPSYDNAIIAYAAHLAWMIIEQGFDGDKKETNYHLGEFARNADDLVSVGVARSRPRKPPTICRGRF